MAGTPRVELITTDGFLYPNAELERRECCSAKVFPSPMTVDACSGFVAEVKAGTEEVRAPVYSHLTYDIVPGEQIVVRRPDVLIVEGLNVLQSPGCGPTDARACGQRLLRLLGVCRCP